MISPIWRPMTNEPHPRDRGQKSVKPSKSNVASPQFLTLLGLITIIAGIEARQREWSWLALRHLTTRYPTLDRISER